MISAEVTPIAPVQADVWFWSLDQDQGADHDAKSLISRDESERADRFVKPIDRRRYIAGRAGLRRVLSTYLDCCPESLSFTYNEWGKPELSAVRRERPHFNLSHTAGRAMLGVCVEAPIGVDIEEIRPLQEDVASHFFTARECADLAGLPEAEQLEGFYRCWTRKEAFVKAHGAGLSLPLTSFDVALEPDDSASLLRRLDRDIDVLDAWTLRNVNAGLGFCAALAVKARGRDVVIRYRSSCD